ncbi:hypothetical protein [Amycolatopsis nigrescens]|uniref:hypothetical protein n=1 Tax=Amycolatopsis nigrescens TaxID=381445 RepID=UPI000360A5FA|nr:hypothetical protein [Amycolatopsis nigrescens]
MATETAAPRGKIFRRLFRRWPSWSGYAAATWSFGYGLLGLLWTLGVPGFPFGEGDVPDAREESLLGGATAAGTAPVLAALGFAGALVALTLARAPARGPARPVLLVLGGAVALLLTVLVSDQRVLVAVAYTPLVLVGIPFGWPPISYAEAVQKLLPWPTVNVLICLVGGLFWVGATIAYQRRGRQACGNCGRTGLAPANWTTPAAAARWGRWAAYTAAFVPLIYAVIRWAWAFHIPLAISPEFFRELHQNGLIWAGAYLATFAAAGGLLTVGLVRRWGEIWPRWVLGLAGNRVPPAFPITAATLVTIALASASSVVIRLSDWTDPAALLRNPMTFWPLWAVGLGAATLAYYFRTRGACLICGRDERAVSP